MVASMTYSHRKGSYLPCTCAVLLDPNAKSCPYICYLKNCTEEQNHRKECHIFQLQNCLCFSSFSSELILSIIYSIYYFVNLTLFWLIDGWSRCSAYHFSKNLAPPQTVLVFLFQRFQGHLLSTRFHSLSHLTIWRNAHYLETIISNFL